MARPSDPPEQTDSDAVPPSETRNLWALAVHFVFLRAGWVFKTETVIMPTFLDTISGAHWLRGCLPVLNRLGASLPPLALAPRLRDTPLKKLALCGATLVMAVPFLLLSSVCFVISPGDKPGWLPALFLGCYAVCFIGTGLNRLAFNTIQGKQIRAHRRGQLVAASGILGSIAAVTGVLLLLPGWLNLPDGNGFRYIFGCTGLGFVAAGACALLIRERPDPPQTGDGETLSTTIRESWGVLRRDADFRRLVVVGMLFISIQLAFPHFARLGRDQLDGGENADLGWHLMLWVVCQSTGFGLGSLPSGWIADRYGNRLAIRLQVLAVAMAPALAILLTSSLVPGGERLYWLTFLLLGLTPLTFRTLNNYTLELAPPELHPRYLSTLSVCLAVPFVASPLVGWLVGWLGFPFVFLAISATVATAGLLTFRLAEPRHRREPAPTSPWPPDTMDPPKPVR